jgi:hypothetical protein
VSDECDDDVYGDDDDDEVPDDGCEIGSIEGGWW